MTGLKYIRGGNAIEIKFEVQTLIHLLSLLIEISEHPDVSGELKEYIEKSILAILKNDPDLKVWVNKLRVVK